MTLYSRYLEAAKRAALEKIDAEDLQLSEHDKVALYKGIVAGARVSYADLRGSIRRQLVIAFLTGSRDIMTTEVAVIKKKFEPLIDAILDLELGADVQDQEDGEEG